MSKPVPTQTPVVEQAAQALNEQAAGLREVLSDAGELARQGIDKARHASQAMREQMSRAGEGTVGYIREEPLKSVLIAAAVGAAATALLSWLASSHRKQIEAKQGR